ncbi:hypothetical protein [uncultured Psychroserpens sp.]|uniref:hypothetical protein n=1 Tax=uncultured Psychroserpens sp. TaxID=255436 RepID=UPI002616A482|nr:hypothetical protein [uncultured Psychroserpens sp.]
MKKYVILVAGYEYHNGRTNIATIAKRRAAFLIRQHRAWRTDPNVNFILFDVRHGRVDKGTVNNGAIHWTLENDSFDAIDDATHYSEERKFIQANTNVISITDAYSYIQNIGKNEPGTVYEFSVLGHGWRGGPVLVNTFERDEFKTNGSQSRTRDPWDKDGRRKDTNVINMDFTRWLYYKNAFANNAYVWVWGCAASRLYKKVIQKVLRSPQFRAKRYGRHLDTDTFDLSFTQEFADRNFAYDPLFFFRSRTPSTTNTRRFSRTLLEVKGFLIRGMVHTYSGQMAHNTKVKTYAALPGTGSDYERGGASGRRVMVVPRNSSVYGYSFNQIVRFYKTYLNVTEDPDRRGYALYDPEIIKSWKGR